MRRHRHFIALGIILFVLSLIPFKSTVVPSWRVRVIDLNGSPCFKQSVSGDWGHYSFSNQSSGEYRKTDINGYVEFPERTMRKNLIQRIMNPLWAHLMVIAHGSVGIHAYVYTSGMVGTGVFGLKYKPGKPMPDKIVVERCIEDKDIP